MAESQRLPSAAIESLEFASYPRRFYFDPQFNATMVWVSQGDFYVTQNPNEVITTVLGSCVAVCVRDPDLLLGGMNHFLLPRVSNGASHLVSNDLRYGSYSIERLVNSIMSHGGRRSRLEIKIFGGAVISSDHSRIGDRNADFVESYLAREGLEVAAQDLRGTSPRRLMYYPATGKVLVNSARAPSVNAIFEIEQKMAESTTPKRNPAILY